MFRSVGGPSRYPEHRWRNLDPNMEKRHPVRRSTPKKRSYMDIRQLKRNEEDADQFFLLRSYQTTVYANIVFKLLNLEAWHRTCWTIKHRFICGGLDEGWVVQLRVLNRVVNSFNRSTPDFKINPLFLLSKQRKERDNDRTLVKI
jgi:hypothetical protein